MREVKQKKIDGKCQEIEELKNRFREFNIHRKVREITGPYKNKTVGRLFSEAGELIVDRKDIKETWKRYIDNLFYNERGNSLITQAETGPYILINVIKAALKEFLNI